MSKQVRDMLSQCMGGLGNDLLDEMVACGTMKILNDHDSVIRQGQYIKNLPIVLEGVVKVYSEEKNTQFLLYHIHAGESCVFSFANLFENKPVDFSGQAEGRCVLLLIPTEKAKLWVSKYPAFNLMILQQYQKHYDDLLHTTRQIVCYNLENRLMAYLETQTQLTDSSMLSISHQHIANDLGTSREVISRLMKKLQKEEKVHQQGRKIKIA